MSDSADSTLTPNGHAAAAAAAPSTASTSSSSAAAADVLVLVVTPILAIVKELQSRLSSLPSGVRVEVADTLNDAHLDEQIARCTVVYGEPKEIKDKLHVSHEANRRTARNAQTVAWQWLWRLTSAP